MTRPFCEGGVLARSCLATVEDGPVGSGEVALVVGGAACVVESGEEDGVPGLVGSDEASVVVSVADSDGAGGVADLLGSNEMSVVVSVADTSEAEEVVGLELDVIRETVGLVESAVVAFTVVGRVVPFEAVVELSLALHCMPCRRVPMMNKQNRQLRKNVRIYCFAGSKFQMNSVQLL